MQAGLRRRIIELIKLALQAGDRLPIGLDLSLRGFDRALHLGLACGQGPGAVLGFLGAALECAQLLARFGQAPLGQQRRIFKFGMELLGGCQLHVQVFETRLADDAALLQGFVLGVDLGQQVGQLQAPAAGSIGLG